MVCVLLLAVITAINKTFSVKKDHCSHQTIFYTDPTNSHIQLLCQNIVKSKSGELEPKQYYLHD